MTHITFRPYRNSDEEGIVDLLSNIYNGWPNIDINCSQVEHWTWKYIDNPENKNIITIAETDSKIVGCFHTTPLKIKIGNTIHSAAYGADYAVHPEFRGKMVSRTLSTQGFEDEKDAGISLHYSITGNPILIKVLSRRHNRFPYPIRNLVKIKDISKQLKKMPVKNPFFVKTGYHVSKLAQRTKNILNLRNPENSFNIVEVEKFDANINDFWDKASKDYYFIIERKKEYLNWRYCDHRAGNYSVKLVMEQDQILGYMVTCINQYRADYPVGYLVDVLALPERGDVVDALIIDALNYFNANDVNIVNFQVLEDHPYEKILQKHGFLDSRIKIFVFFNTLGNENPFKNTKNIGADKIFVTWGDHDVLPVTMPKYT